MDQDGYELIARAAANADLASLLGQAGEVEADTLIAAAAKWGYNLEPIRPALQNPNV